MLTARPDITYYGVDSWKPPFQDALTKALAVREQFTPRMHLVNLESIPASKSLKGNIHPDLVYIDAAHDYKSVLQDLEAWWPVLKPGGIFAGRDYETKPGVQPWGPVEVEAAVNDWMRSKGLSFNIIQEPSPTWWVRKETI